MSQILSKFSCDFDCNFVSGFHCIKHFFRRHLCHISEGTWFLIFCKTHIGKSCDSCCRSILFQTAFLSTSTGFCLLVVYTQMTDLSASTVCPYKALSIHDDSTANTGSKGNHNNILVTFSATFPHLTKRSYICIIPRNHFHSVKKLFQFTCHFFVSPSEICCILNNSILGYRCRKPHSKSDDLFLHQFLFCHLCFHCLRNIREDCFSLVLSTCLDLPFVKKLSVFLKKSHLYCRSAYIDTKTIFHLSPAPYIFFFRFSCTRRYSSCAAL